MDPADVAAVVVSHLHPDHFIDLVPLRHYLRWEQPRRRVRVLGPADLAARLDALHDESSGEVGRSEHPDAPAGELPAQVVAEGHKVDEVVRMEVADHDGGHVGRIHQPSEPRERALAEVEEQRGTTLPQQVGRPRCAWSVRVGRTRPDDVESHRRYGVVPWSPESPGASVGRPWCPLPGWPVLPGLLVAAGLPGLSVGLPLPGCGVVAGSAP